MNKRHVASCSTYCEAENMYKLLCMSCTNILNMHDNETHFAAPFKILPTPMAPQPTPANSHIQPQPWQGTDHYQLPLSTPWFRAQIDPSWSVSKKLSTCIEIPPGPWTRHPTILGPSCQKPQLKHDNLTGSKEPQKTYCSCRPQHNIVETMWSLILCVAGTSLEILDYRW